VVDHNPPNLAAAAVLVLQQLEQLKCIIIPKTIYNSERNLTIVFQLGMDFARVKDTQ